MPEESTRRWLNGSQTALLLLGSALPSRRGLGTWDGTDVFGLERQAGNGSEAEESEFR